MTRPGWAVTREYVDEGVSGATERRPALDALVNDAKRRRVDVVVCWRLDRLGRNLRHLVTLLDDLQGLGIAFVSLGEPSTAGRPAAFRSRGIRSELRLIFNPVAPTVKQC